MNQGFSLTDVLVSLLLITSTSLALLKQQWQVSQFFNQLQTRATVVLQLENDIECETDLHQAGLVVVS